MATDFLYNLLFENKNNDQENVCSEKEQRDQPVCNYGDVLTDVVSRKQGITSTRDEGAEDTKGMKRRQIALDRNAVVRDLQQQCGCPEACYKKFTPGDVLFWRQKLHSLTEGPERMTKLIELIRLTALDLKRNEKLQKYRIDQKLICRKTMIFLILRVSVATFSRARAHALNGIVKKDPIKDKVTNAVKGKILEGFIKSYVSSVCDRDPAQQKYRIPTSLCRNNIFSMYENQYPDDHLQKSRFYSILKEKFKDISFNKTQRLTKCTECADYRYLIESEKDPYQRSLIEAERNLHILEQQIEREAYYVRRAQAEMRPKQFISLILDGMDQNKTDLPHYVQWNTPNGAGTQKLRTHVTGSIVHGRGKYCFIDYNQYQHNTNLTLSCMLSILLKESKEGKLPPTLYVQLDNTARENKNKYFLGFVSYLIKKNIFREAYISFLLVGHTHEDVDQMFSKISHALKKTEAITAEELKAVINGSQQPVPHVEDITSVWNISGWLEAYINQVHNVTFPKMYRIFNDETGHTTVKFKVLSTDPVWRPLPDERPLEIFQLDQHMKQKVPQGHPEIVTPMVDTNDWDDLKRSLQHDFRLAQFTNQRVNWWTAFLEDKFSRESFEEWPVSSLTSFFEEESVGTLGEKERELVEKYRDKRNILKQVYTANNVAGYRGIYQDRRFYKVGGKILIRRSENEVIVGEVRNVNENSDVQVEIFSKDGNKYVPTQRTETFPVEKCYPGTFELTNSGCLPLRIRERMRENRNS